MEAGFHSSTFKLPWATNYQVIDRQLSAEWKAFASWTTYICQLGDGHLPAGRRTFASWAKGICQLSCGHLPAEWPVTIVRATNGPFVVHVYEMWNQCCQSYFMLYSMICIGVPWHTAPQQPQYTCTLYKLSILVTVFCSILCRYLHEFYTMVNHLIPAYLADLGYCMMGKKPR